MITCRYCNKPTCTTGPIFIKRIQWNRFSLAGVCEVCGETKYKFLNNQQTKQLPQIIYDSMSIPGYAINYVFDRSRTKHDLLPLVSAIISV